MKHLRLLFMLVLTLTGITNVAAEEEIVDGEAFYIYRNDGQFDGFFYDQVQEMRYSKLDLDSVEQADYVVYEVVTADSTFRIPLAAIDSIGFVQPEIKFAPKVRHMDFLGMTPYVSSVDGMTLTFLPTLPDDMMPRYDDMLLGFTGVLEENGFGGRVMSVDKTGDGIVVRCEKPTQLSDVFERFVTVEQVGSYGDNSRVVRRMAGYNQLKSSTRGYSGGPSMTLVDINLNSQIPLIPDIASVGIHLNVGANVSFKVRMCVVAQITSSSYFVKTRFTEDYNIQLGVSAGIHGSDFKKISLIPGIPIKFPAACPLFEVRPTPEFGVRYGGDFSVKVSFPPVSGSLRQTFTMDSSNPGITYTGNEEEKQTDEVPTKSILETLDANLTLSGYLQLGIKQPCGIYSNGWFDWLFSAGMGMDLFIGPKLEGSVDFSASSYLKGNGDPYTLKDSKIAFTPLALDYEAYGEYGDIMLGDNKFKWTFADGSFSLGPKLEMNMFPTLSLKEATYDEKSREIRAFMKSDQSMVFMPSEIGIGVMDSNKKDVVDMNYQNKLGFASFAAASMDDCFSTKNYKAGVYYVVPMLKAFGGDFPVRSEAKRVEVPPYLDVAKDSLKADKNGQIITIPLKTNANHVEAITTTGWIHAEVISVGKDSLSKSIKVTVDKNADVFKRNGDLTIYVSDEQSSLETEETLHFAQEPAGTIQWASFSVGYIANDGETGAVSPVKPFRVSQTREGDILTVTGTGVFKEGKYGYSPEAVYQPSILQSEASITLTIDMNPENPRIITGSITFHDRMKFDVNYDEWTYTHEDYECTANASFSNVPIVFGSLTGYDITFNGPETCIESISGSEHYVWSDKRGNALPQSGSEHRTFANEGGVWIDLYYEAPPFAPDGW